MSNEWKELDVKRVPTDILADGAWELQWRREDPDKDSWVHVEYTHFSPRNLEAGYKIRRPEGWEPKECPTCGSTNKHVHCCKSGFCPDSWHYESIKPTHEERCETLSNDIYSAMNKYSFQSTAFQEAIMKAVDFLLKQSAG